LREKSLYLETVLQKPHSSNSLRQVWAREKKTKKLHFCVIEKRFSHTHFPPTKQKQNKKEPHNRVGVCQVLAMILFFNDGSICF